MGFVLGGVVGALLGVGDVMGLVGCVDCGGVAKRSCLAELMSGRACAGVAVVAWVGVQLGLLSL